MCLNTKCHARRIAVFTALSTVLLAAAAAEAAIIHVYEGESIQAAIDGCAGGDEIIVHAGTYYETIDFLGKAIWLHSSDGPGETTVDATGLGASVVKCVTDEPPETILEGFTITGGTGSLLEFMGYTFYVGGGMYTVGSSPTVRSCVFVGNQALQGDALTGTGGGMFCWDGGAPTVLDCTFEGNTANTGGGFAAVYAEAVVTGSTFIGNTAVQVIGGGYGFGGGAYLEGSNSIIDCEFEGNWAESFGGAIMLRSDLEGVDGLILGCKFLNNHAENYGGGIANIRPAGSPYECLPRIIGCLFEGNSAFWGGGVYNLRATPTLTNCTFSLNESFSGAGMGSQYSSYPIVANCIFWGDIGNEIVNDGSSTATVSYSDVQAVIAYPGPGNINEDPLFVDPANGNYRLSPGSPCIDAGDCTAVPPGITTDLDGNPRFVDDPNTPDTGTGYPCVDIGAYEFQAGPMCPADINGDGVVDVLDLLAVLAAWGATSGPEDINGDGIVNVLDILEVLGQWGPCT